jgi:hypothetical protein
MHPRFLSILFDQTIRHGFSRVEISILTQGTSTTGDLNGRIFANWAIFSSGCFFNITRKSTYLFWQRTGRATFWTILLQSHLVTLINPLLLKK